MIDLMNANLEKRVRFVSSTKFGIVHSCAVSEINFLLFGLNKAEGKKVCSNWFSVSHISPARLGCQPIIVCVPYQLKHRVFSTLCQGNKALNQFSKLEFFKAAFQLFTKCGQQEGRLVVIKKWRKTQMPVFHYLSER